MKALHRHALGANTADFHCHNGSCLDFPSLTGTDLGHIVVLG